MQQKGKLILVVTQENSRAKHCCTKAPVICKMIDVHYDYNQNMMI